MVSALEIMPVLALAFMIVLIPALGQPIEARARSRDRNAGK